MKKLIRVYDINWFYNYEDHTDIPKEEYDATFNAEPTEMIIDVSDWDEEDLQDDCIEDRISDYISDESGYYHEGYSFEWVISNITLEEIEENNIHNLKIINKMEEKYYFKEFQKMLDGVQTLIEKDKTILQNKKFIRFMKKFGYEYDGNKVYFVFDKIKINK